MIGIVLGEDDVPHILRIAARSSTSPGRITMLRADPLTGISDVAEHEAGVDEDETVVGLDQKDRAHQGGACMRMAPQLR